ncbi:unnamed protein product, partial [marine sediment metagenome]
PTNEPTLTKLREMRLHGLADAWLEQQQQADMPSWRAGCR